MELIWTAFFLGLVGSLHCVGMCGPLALALPMTGHTRAAFLAGRAAYNLGRITTYGALGAVFGLVGQTLALAGLQRWVSLIAGVAILLALIASSRFALVVAAAKVVTWLKAGLAKRFLRRTISSLFTLGLLNGLLPCGLVYVSCAAAAASGRILSGIESMLAFGVGTVPMMLGLALAGQRLQFVVLFKLQKLVPAGLTLVGVLLLLRGLSLGIPYLSPDLSGTHPCH